MILSTLLNLIVVPVLYVVVERLRERVHRSKAVHPKVRRYDEETLLAASMAFASDGTLLAVSGSNGDRRTVRIATLGERPAGD